MKLKIKEVIVVEGKDDTRRIKEVVDADTIETMGSAIHEDILEQIEHAEEISGVIVFTDPDFVGEKIRKIIMEAVPSVKHAFLAKREAKPRSKLKGGSLGVEHASDDAILEALQKIVTPAEEEFHSEIDRRMLYNLGLLDGVGSREKRARVGEILRIGYTNGQQLLKRLQIFRIEKDELMRVVREIIGE